MYHGILLIYLLVDYVQKHRYVEDCCLISYYTSSTSIFIITGDYSALFQGNLK